MPQPHITPVSPEASKYEYHLCFWGQVDNNHWIERDLGIAEKDFWFRSEKERNQFKAKLEAVAKAHNVIIVFGEHEGFDVRKRTVARMLLTLPDGRAFPFEYDFGFGYPIDAAEYMFVAGNYSCDCNRSLFLSRQYPEVEETNCGYGIEMSTLIVTKEDAG